MQQKLDEKSMSSSIEQMIWNTSFYDTVLVCLDGKMKVNRLTLGLVFPYLKSCDVLQFPVENVIMLPDYSQDHIQSLIAISLGENEDCSQTPGGSKLEEYLRLPAVDIIGDIKKEFREEHDEGDVPTFSFKQENGTEEDFNNYDMMGNDLNDSIDYSDNSDEEYTPNINDAKKRKKRSSPFVAKLDDLKFDLEVANAKYNTLFQNIKETSTKVKIDGVEKVECSSCRESVANLSIHVARNHSDMDFKCPYCTHCTGSFGLLKTHMKLHFTNSKEPHDIEKMECSICFKKVLNLKEHTDLVHERKLLHGCHICEKKCPNKSQLKKHIASHMGIKEACPICSKEIAARHLKEHIKVVHEKIKNHCCTECGMAFFARRALEKHMRTHTGEKTICADCGKAVANIVSHMKIVHSGKNRQVVCPQCGKKVVNLKKHISEVHEKGAPEFLCPHADCDYKTCMKNNLNTHLKAHEKGTQGKYRPTGFGKTRELFKKCRKWDKEEKNGENLDDNAVNCDDYIVNFDDNVGD